MVKDSLCILLIAVFSVMIKGAAYANGRDGGHESGLLLIAGYSLASLKYPKGG